MTKAMSNSAPIRVGVVGGTGYTGAELLRLLCGHPRARLQLITSRADAGTAVADMFPNLRGLLDLKFAAPDPAALKQCDLVFFATPNGTAMTMVPELLDAGMRVIDLAADFRLKDAEEWARWYGKPHACPQLLPQAVYGLPEMHRQAIRGARLVANPGCYVTAVTLGFLPLIERGLVDTSRLIADGKSGVSGAGRGLELRNLFSEASDSFRAYAASGHRHLPEMQQNLRNAGADALGLSFVPHLVPMVRGIHATLYAELISNNVDVQAVFVERFRAEPFVDVMPAGSHPETRSVRGANLCRIAIHRPEDGRRVIVLSVIDNLVKGAAGQAIQNMNLMFGFDETAGLGAPALLP
jgi:N-acetyl-gamma-glutamyl-phosphate reductase